MLAVDRSGAYLVTPRLPLSVNGAGDVTAALFLAHLPTARRWPWAGSPPPSSPFWRRPTCRGPGDPPDRRAGADRAPGGGVRGPRPVIPPPGGGYRRCMPSRQVWAVHDGHRAPRMRDHPLAGGPEDHPGESAPAAATDHDQPWLARSRSRPHQSADGVTTTDRRDQFNVGIFVGPADQFPVEFVGLPPVHRVAVEQRAETRRLAGHVIPDAHRHQRHLAAGGHVEGEGG